MEVDNGWELYNNPATGSDMDWPAQVQGEASVPSLEGPEWDAEDQAMIDFLLTTSSPKELNKGSNRSSGDHRRVKATCVAPKRKLTPAERRARHREVVKRSYHRNKETLNNLRNNVKDLEAELCRLTVRKNGGGSTDAEKESCVSAPEDVRCDAWKVKCADLSSTSKELKEESLRLRMALHKHQEFVSLVQECYEDEVVSSHSSDDDFSDDAECIKRIANSPTSVEDGTPSILHIERLRKRAFEPTHVIDISPPAPIAREARREVGFSPLSVAHVRRVADRAYQEILQFTFNGQAISSGARVMGWEDKRLVDNTRIKFSFKKQFSGYSALDLMSRTWQCMSDPECAESRFRGLLTLRILQRVNDDMIIAMRDTLNTETDKVFRCVYLLFRVRTDNGFCICLRSFDSWKEEAENEAREPTKKFRGDGKQIKWVDMFGWFHFNHLGFDEQSSYYQETGAQVEYGGSMDYGEVKTIPTLAMDMLTVVLRWEGFFVGPIIRLPSSG